MSYHPCVFGCGRYLAPQDSHDCCLTCLGIQHAEEAFMDGSCTSCGDMTILELRNRLRYVKHLPLPRSGVRPGTRGGTASGGPRQTRRQVQVALRRGQPRDGGDCSSGDGDCTTFSPGGGPAGESFISFCFCSAAGPGGHRGRSGSAELDGTSGDEGELDGASGDEGELGGTSGDEGELGGTSGDEGELGGTKSRGRSGSADSWGRSGGADSRGRSGGADSRGARETLTLGGALVALSLGGAREALTLGGAREALTLGGALVGWTEPEGALECWTEPAGALECWMEPRGALESWMEPAGVLESTYEESALEGTGEESALEGTGEERTQEGAGEEPELEGTGEEAAKVGCESPPRTADQYELWAAVALLHLVRSDILSCSAGSKERGVEESNQYSFIYWPTRGTQSMAEDKQYRTPDTGKTKA